MRRIIIIFLVTFLSGAIRAQNFVANGDFELHTGCSFSSGQIDSALHWHNPSLHVYGTPDYLNQCATSPYFGVPSNMFGWQNARSGSGYGGIVIAREHTNTNFREYAEVSLKSPLITNTCYHFEMYISLADYSEYTSTDLGIYFSDTIVTNVPNFNPLPFVPQISNPAGNVPDTLNWILVSGNYTAAGNESYLIIGNFKYAYQTPTTLVNSSSPTDYSYVYIDDVSLTPCSINTGINASVENSRIQVYPNPSNGRFNISVSVSEKNTTAEIYNSTGALVYNKQITGTCTIDLTDQADGIYFIRVMNENKMIGTQKIMKH